MKKIYIHVNLYFKQIPAVIAVYSGKSGVNNCTINSSIQKTKKTDTFGVFLNGIGNIWNASTFMHMHIVLKDCNGFL